MSQCDIQNEGELHILEKAVVIPERELWLHKNQKSISAVEKGIVEAKKGKIQKNAVDLKLQRRKHKKLQLLP